MALSFFKQKRLFYKVYTTFGTWFSCLQIVCRIWNCPKIRQDKNSIKFWEFLMSEQRKLEKWTVFCKSWEGWFISAYTDRLLANQITGKPVGIHCHTRNIYKYLDCHIKPELTGLEGKGRQELGWNTGTKQAPNGKLPQFWIALGLLEHRNSDLFTYKSKHLNVK